MAHKIMVPRRDLKSLKQRTRGLIQPRIRSTLNLAPKIAPGLHFLATGRTGLGPELVPSTSFANWTLPVQPDGWDNYGPQTASNFWEEGTPSGARMVSDGLGGINNIDITGTPLVVGQCYQIEYEYSAKVASALRSGGGLILAMNAGVGVRTIVSGIIAGSGTFDLRHSGGVTDVTLSYYSVREHIC